MLESMAQSVTAYSVNFVLGNFKELADFNEQRFVSFVIADVRNAVFAKDLAAVRRGALADSAERADRLILPDANDDVGVRRVRARHRNAVGPHDGKEGFDAVNSVPVQGRMLSVNRARASRVGAVNLADRAIVAHLLIRLDVTQRRRGKDRHVRRFGKFENFQYVFERTAHRLVDIDGLFRRNDGLNLFQVQTAVDAFAATGGSSAAVSAATGSSAVSSGADGEKTPAMANAAA